MTFDVSARTKRSPRFVGDTICFYRGDVFDIKFFFDLTCDGEEVGLSETDEVVFEFALPDMIPAFCEKRFSGISGRIINFEWDEEWTKNFKSGRYVYRIKHYSERGICTICAYGTIIVE